MAQQTETRWEETDGKLHAEETISPVNAKQGRAGTRILAVLIAALVLAFIIWIPVEIWGKKEAAEVAPQQPGQRLQSEQPATPPSPSLQNGNAVPTETQSQPTGTNTAPATPKTTGQ
ncbi:hypothetical protein FZ934_17510 [Rhizobium grahamii]|uniref:Transmembrane protein n=1 Tax=Rhizobium grahamii TaxID=1120045 RepID=A0A5Q0C9B2_9HYPH|nr:MULTISPECIES: hypothetical protein [Rhizobium]QFY62033.1 hypothetical protein FZ934_17510 [Rhizobium grahamii]QRM48790.1 hypothetical protein F3Y33_05385 [Rhizobium sp. BG6]